MSGSGFQVDLDKLEDAAAGIDGILHEVSTQPLGAIPREQAVVGHPAVADALGGFATGWEQGVNDLVGDGAGIVGRLRANVAAYRAVEDHLVWVCGGLVGTGTDPGVS